MKATVEEIDQWWNLFYEYKDKLTANRKTGEEITEYLKKKYPVIQLKNREVINLVMTNYRDNGCYHGEESKLTPEAYLLKNEGTGELLYSNRPVKIAVPDILIGIEKETGFVFVDGCPDLYDELVAFRGLNEKEKEDFYLVAEYIEAYKRINNEFPVK